MQNELKRIKTLLSSSIDTANKISRRDKKRTEFLKELLVTHLELIQEEVTKLENTTPEELQENHKFVQVFVPENLEFNGFKSYEFDTESENKWVSVNLGLKECNNG